jgi:hypothetical protein
MEMQTYLTLDGHQDMLKGRQPRCAIAPALRYFQASIRAGGGNIIQKTWRAYRARREIKRQSTQRPLGDGGRELGRVGTLLMPRTEHSTADPQASSSSGGATH